MELLQKADAENVQLEVIIIENLAGARKADVATQGEGEKEEEQSTGWGANSSWRLERDQERADGVEGG